MSFLCLSGLIVWNKIPIQAHNHIESIKYDWYMYDQQFYHMQDF